MVANEHLFSRLPWHDVAQNQLEALVHEIDSIDGDRLLNTSPDKLCEYFERKYEIDVPVLVDEKITVQQRETQIDISRDWNRNVHDRSRPHYIAGTAIDVTVPYSGDRNVFTIQPTTFTLNPPLAEVRIGALVFTLKGVQLASEKVKAEIEKNITAIRENLERLRSSADTFNARIRPTVREA
ncbi:MAG: hypothetical protein R3D98_15170 [Candidatus Krumholzibacteriia bacterium]